MDSPAQLMRQYESVHERGVRMNTLVAKSAIRRLLEGEVSELLHTDFPGCVLTVFGGSVVTFFDKKLNLASPVCRHRSYCRGEPDPDLGLCSTHIRLLTPRKSPTQDTPNVAAVIRATEKEACANIDKSIRPNRKQGITTEEDQEKRTGSDMKVSVGERGHANAKAGGEIIRKEKPGGDGSRKEGAGRDGSQKEDAGGVGEKPSMVSNSQLSPWESASKSFNPAWYEDFRRGPCSSLDTESTRESYSDEVEEPLYSSETSEENTVGKPSPRSPTTEDGEVPCCSKSVTPLPLSYRPAVDEDDGSYDVDFDMLA